ncbi:Rv1733c family protein [Kitasatospora indigofera]|uniref:Rv1733c family protein n=1 Tax=Kitasatospora indigofera TaxID=67307 RepID=UPI0033BAF2AF
MATARPGAAGHAFRATFRTHVRRAAGREPNPLGRRSDLLRSRLVVALTIALLFSLALTLLTALAVLRAGQREARYEGQHRHRVTATTVAAALTDSTGSRSGVGGSHAQAVWHFPAGVPASGPIKVGPDAPAGTQRTIWVDDRGRPVSAPRPGTEIATTAVLTGTGTLTLLSGAAFAAYWLGNRRVDRRTTAAWAKEWEGVEPEWSGRRRRQGLGDQ